MADDLSLLLKIKGDAESGKAAIAQTRAAVAQLRAGLGSDFSAIQNAGQSALGGLSEHLNLFVGERIPLVGGAFVRLTENLREFGEEGKKGEAEIAKFDKTLDGLSTSTGKSKSELINFLTSFVQLESQAKRDTAAIETFGAGVAEKLIPELEKAGTQLGEVAIASTGAASSFAGMAGPLGLAVLGMLATVAAAGLLGETLFKSAESTAEFEDKLFNLSRQLGISVETLSGLEILAKQSGLDISELGTSLGIFQRHLEQAQDPTSKSASLLKSLGIDSRDTEEALRQTITTLARMPEGFHQTAAALDLFGRGGKAVLAILKQTDGDLDVAIEKFRQIGLIVSEEDAKAAHEFTDQMALLGFQLRASSAVIGREVIPAIIDLSSELSAALKENHQAIEDIGIVASALAHLFTEPLKGAFDTIIGVSKSFHLALTGLRGAALAYAAGLDTALASLIALHNEQGKDGGEAPKSFTAGVGGTKSAELEQQSQLIDLNTIKNAATEAKQIATDMIQSIGQQFEKGEITKRQEILGTIRILKEGEAEQQKAIQARIDSLELEKKTAVDTVAIDQKIDDARSQARTTRRQLDADVSKQQTLLASESIKREIQNITDSVTAFQSAADAKLQINQNLVAAFQRTELQGLAVTFQLTEQKFAVVETALLKQRELAGKNVDIQEKINTELNTLDAARTKFRLENAELVRKAEEKINLDAIETLKIRIDNDVRLSQLAADGSIASLKALAALKVKTEEDTEREILRVRLTAKGQEIEATKAKQTAAGAIADPQARALEEARLNGELKILLAERTAIERQGERDTADGHQRDLDNESKYANELLRIERYINQIERESARESIDLLIINRASRLEILKAQVDEEVRAENERHDEIQSAIQAELNAARKKHQDETAIHKLQEAEAERHRLALKRISDQEAKDKALGGPGGGFAGGLETGQLAKLANGVKSFADIASVAFSAVGAAVNGLAQGVGNLVQQWVLMGEVGPHAMRKLVASILAGVAQQAAVMAIMELAYGIAALTPWGAVLYGPAAPHFKASALFASVAAIAAVAGRATAGDAFQSSSSAGGGASGSGGSISGGGSGSNQGQSLTLGSQRAQMIVHKIVPPPGWLHTQVKESLNANDPELNRILARDRG